MSIEPNKTTIRRLIEDVVNTGNVARLDELVSPDFRESADVTAQMTGVDAMRAHVLGVRNTFPDLHLIIDGQIGEGDWVATRITAEGTHLGWWLGIKPTGRRVRITGVNIDRVVDGRIVEHGGAANMFEALLSVGAIKVVGEQSVSTPD